MDCQLLEACCRLSVDEMTRNKSGSQKQKSCGIGCLLSGQLMRGKRRTRMDGTEARVKLLGRSILRVASGACLSWRPAFPL